jgi:hypothetical protein
LGQGWARVGARVGARLRLRLRVRDEVVDPGARLGVNPAGVLEDGGGIDAAGDRAAMVDLLLGVGVGVGLKVAVRGTGRG